MTKTNGDKASIREVYQIAQRLEDKIDKLQAEVANIKGQATILGAVAGFAVTVVGWFINK